MNYLYLIALLLISPSIVNAQTIEKVGDKFVEVSTVTVTKELGNLDDMRTKVEELSKRKEKLEAERDNYNNLIRETEEQIGEILAKFYEPVIEAELEAEATKAIANEELSEPVIPAVEIPTGENSGINWSTTDVLGK